MNIEVRYFSRSGNTKRIGEAIAKGAGVIAKSITEEDNDNEYIDLLFLGGAPYANVMDSKLREYALGLSNEKVGNVVLFTTSNWSRRTVKGLRKILTVKDIKVDDEYFYAHMLNINGRISMAYEFGKRKKQDYNKGE